MPYYPTPGKQGGHQYTTATEWEKLVADYAGISLIEAGDLDYLTFLTYRRDAYIHKLEQTEAGQEYLDNCWRMEQTEPDRSALRKKLRKEDK